MVENPVILTCESPHLSRFMRLSHKPTSNFGYLTRIPANPVQIAAFRSSSSRSYRNPIALSSFKELGRSDIGFRQLGYDWFRLSAVSNDGSGGSGGYGGGGFGDGKSGGGGGGDERKWSLLSWYLTLLEKYPVLTKAVTSAILTFVGDLTCQLAIDKVPSLDLKRIFLFTFLGLVLVGPTLHFW